MTRPHVVVLVGAGDPRVETGAFAVARALAELGARVTVVGPARGPRREDEDRDGVRLVRVPVDLVLRGALDDRRAARRAGQFLTPDPGRALRRRWRLLAAARSAQAYPGPAGAARRAAVEVRRAVLRASGAGRRRAARRVAVGWSSIDRRLGGRALGVTVRRVIPEVDDLEIALGPVVDELRPDALHVYGVHLLGVAAGVRARAARAGRAVRAVYHVPEGSDGPSGPVGARRSGVATTREDVAWATWERRHRRFVDQVIVGSDRLAELLDPVYRPLLRSVRDPRPGAGSTGTGRSGATASGTGRSGATATGRAVLAIGPANSAGQGWAWGRAAERHLVGVDVHVLAIRNRRYDFPADEYVEARTYRTDPDWQAGRLADAHGRWTHALFEAGRPLLGGLAGRDFTGDETLLTAAAVRTGLVLHGSEVRDPRRHAQRHGDVSPFTDPHRERTKALQERADGLLPLVHAFARRRPGAVFVSTPDQLDDVPEAIWLPVVVDTARFRPRREALTRGRPLVVHAPSTPWLKGTDTVVAVVGALAERGLVEFRLVTGMPPDEAAALIAEADIVVDQLLLGLYGVLACEAMASGTLVVGYLGDALRRRVDRPVPIVETTAHGLGEAMTRILDDRDAARARAAEGPGFVRAVHDGRRSAAVLAPFLGRTTTVGDLLPDPEPAEVPRP